MLALDSPRWCELHPFFGSPEDIPRVLADWLRSIGFDQEELIYSRDLFHLFLHQNTNSDVAYAVVPWLIEAATNRQSPQAIRYIADAATVEMNRLHYGTYWPQSEAGVEPEGWLAADYREAIRRATSVANDLFETECRSEERDLLWRAIKMLWGNSKLTETRWFGGRPPTE